MGFYENVINKDERRKKKKQRGAPKTHKATKSVTTARIDL
jgi:uncharacterized protein (DUF4415 family)